MNVTATEFKQRFGHYSTLVREGAEESIEVTWRGEVIGIYHKPRKTDRIPFLGVSLEGYRFDREDANER